MANSIESVWDYPRPPKLDRTASYLVVMHCGVVLAETTKAMRVLETSHPPVYYIPPADIAMKFLRRSSRRSSYCEFKGSATYWNIEIPDSAAVEQRSCVSTDAAWSYERPSPAYADLRGYLAFYASKVDECSVDEERVVAQAGDFYGGWITSRVKGPFKGAAGTLGW